MQLASHYSKSQLKKSFASCSIPSMHKLQETIKKHWGNTFTVYIYTSCELTDTRRLLPDKWPISVKRFNSRSLKITYIPT